MDSRDWPLGGGGGAGSSPRASQIRSKIPGKLTEAQPNDTGEVSVSFSRKGLSGRGRQVAGQGCSHLRFDWDGETCSKVTHVAAGRRPWFPVPWGMRGRAAGGTGFLLRGQHPGGQVTADRSNPRSPRVLGYRRPHHAGGHCQGQAPSLFLSWLSCLTVGERHHVTGMWGSRDGVWSFLLPSRPGIWVVWNTLLGAVCWATGRETGSPVLQVN